MTSTYGWNNIATIRRSISRNRSNAEDRYAKYGDPVRYSVREPSQHSPLATTIPTITPSRAGSTDTGIHSSFGSSGNGMQLYPHLEERSMISHNPLRPAKSEYFLSTGGGGSQQSHYQRPIYLGVKNLHKNIDDDTKWINSSSSTASYHSAGSSSRGGAGNVEEVDEDEEVFADDRTHLYAEIRKPVSVVVAPPVERALPYRRFANGRVNSVGDAGATNIYQQTNGHNNKSVGDNTTQPPPSSQSSSSTTDLRAAVRNTQTPPPPASLSMSSGNGTAAHNHQPRKFFTLNPPRNQSKQHQQVLPNHNDRSSLYQRRTNPADDLRRRSMTPLTTNLENMNGNSSCASLGDGGYQSQHLLNRSQSCYVDPLDYKVGCQNTLRSKPLIPWYELAIKDKNRRSCPQFEVLVNRLLANVTFSLLLTFVSTTDQITN